MKKFTILFLLSVLIGGLSNGFGQVNLDSGLVGYWPFNGNANDESVNGNNGTVNGATLTTDRFGNGNSAYSFDGSNTYIDVSDNNSLDLTSAFTLSVWIYQTNTYFSGYRLIDKITAEQQDGFGFDTYGNGDGQRGRLMGQINAISNSSYSLNAWHNLMVVYNIDSVIFYIDGVYDGKYP